MMGSTRTDVAGPSSRSEGQLTGEVFVGGLSWGTTEEFYQYFAKFGEIKDFVIMRDWETGRPRGYGFVAFTDPSLIDRVMEGFHVIHGKQVDIKRAFRRAPVGSLYIRTRKIFVGGIPSNVTEDQFRDFFKQYGEVKDYKIEWDTVNNCSQGFGFITFDSAKVVDDLVATGSHVPFAGSVLNIMKSRQNESNAQSPSLASSYGGGHGDANDVYGGSVAVGGYMAGGVAIGDYMSGGNHGGMSGAFVGYGGGVAIGGYMAGGNHGGMSGVAVGGYMLGGNHGGMSGAFDGCGGGVAVGGYMLGGNHGGMSGAFDGCGGGVAVGGYMLGGNHGGMSGMLGGNHGGMSGAFDGCGGGVAVGGYMLGGNHGGMSGAFDGCGGGVAVGGYMLGGNHGGMSGAFDGCGGGIAVGGYMAGGNHGGMSGAFDGCGGGVAVGGYMLGGNHGGTSGAFDGYGGSFAVGGRPGDIHGGISGAYGNYGSEFGGHGGHAGAAEDPIRETLPAPGGYGGAGRGYDLGGSGGAGRGGSFGRGANQSGHDGGQGRLKAVGGLFFEKNSIW